MLTEESNKPTYRLIRVNAVEKHTGKRKKISFVIDIFSNVYDFSVLDIESNLGFCPDLLASPSVVGQTIQTSLIPETCKNHKNIQMKYCSKCVDIFCKYCPSPPRTCICNFS